MKAFYELYGLELQFILTRKRRLVIYVTVDGDLAVMQLMNMSIKNAIKFYLLRYEKKKKLKSVAVNLTALFYKSNYEGVKKITEGIFEIATSLNAQPHPLALQPSLLTNMESNKKASKEVRIVKKILFLISKWFSGESSNSEIIILLDQCIETWLKYRLGLHKNASYGFKKVVKEAFEKGLISNNEKLELEYLHTIRNRVQHRGGSANKGKVIFVIKCCIKLINKYCV